MAIIKPSEQQLAWLDEAVAKDIPYAEMARHIGCCTDTLKRILHRHSIVKFQGAKYQSRNELQGPQWTRPCMRCKSTEERPKWQFFCSVCTEENESDSHNWDGDTTPLSLRNNRGARAQ